MVCSQCGKGYDEGSKFCASCGHSFEQKGEQAVTEVTLKQATTASYAAQGVEFFDAIKICITKYADVKGRASRSEFWWFSLFSFLVWWAMFLPVIGFVFALANIILLIPKVTVSTRRLHDVGWSGWWLLIALTIVGILFLLVLWCLPGKEEATKYDLVQE